MRGLHGLGDGGRAVGRGGVVVGDVGSHECRDMMEHLFEGLGKVMSISSIAGGVVI